ncbi:peptidase M50 [Alicyclobacillus contaminans]|nr:peptidase M50 [Alicyclobacillus contaminans]
MLLFLLVMLHELGHAAMADHLGYVVEEVSLLPFGGVAKLGYGSLGFRPRHEALIAVAGPLVNVALSALAFGMHALGWWTHAFYIQVVELNLWIVVFNLLPGLPLDGGRVLRAARSRTIGYEQATREAYQVAIWIAVVLLCAGALSLWVGYPHLGMVILGLFLLTSAFVGRRDTGMDTIRFLDAKRKAGPSPEPVRALAVPATATVRDVVRQFAPDRYHMVYIRDEEGVVRAVVEEDELIDAVFAGEYLVKMEAWLHRER